MQNCGSQKEGNFCKMNRKKEVETFFLQSQRKVRAFCFCCVYLSYSGNYLNLFLGSDTFVSRHVNLICILLEMVRYLLTYFMCCAQLTFKYKATSNTNPSSLLGKLPDSVIQLTIKQFLRYSSFISPAWFMFYFPLLCVNFLCPCYLMKAVWFLLVLTANCSEWSSKK